MAELAKFRKDESVTASPWLNPGALPQATAPGFRTGFTPAQMAASAAVPSALATSPRIPSQAAVRGGMQITRTADQNMLGTPSAAAIPGAATSISGSVLGFNNPPATTEAAVLGSVVPPPTTPRIVAPRRAIGKGWDGNPTSHTEAPVIPMATNQLGEAWAPIEGEPKLSTMSSGGFRAINPGGIKAMDVPAGGGYAESNGQVFRLRGATPEELAANKAADAAYVPPVSDPNAIVQTIGTANGVQQLKAGEELTPDVGSLGINQLISYRAGQKAKELTSAQNYRASLARQAEVNSAATMAKLPVDIAETEAKIKNYGVAQDVEYKKLGMESKKLDGLLQTWKSSAALDDAKTKEVESKIKWEVELLKQGMKGTTGGGLPAEKLFEGRKGAASIAKDFLTLDPIYLASKDPKVKSQMLKDKTDEVFEGMLEAAAPGEPLPAEGGVSPRKSLKQVDPKAYEVLRKKAETDPAAYELLAKNSRAIY